MDKNSAKYLSPLMLWRQKTDLLVCENYSRFGTEIKIMQYVCLLPKYFAHRAKYGIYNCIAGKIKAIAFKKKKYVLHWKRQFQIIHQGLQAWKCTICTETGERVECLIPNEWKCQSKNVQVNTAFVNLAKQYNNWMNLLELETHMNCSFDFLLSKTCYA